MIPAIIVGAVALVVLLVGIRLVKAGPRGEPGVDSFRKHIDALSPEARREVMDRVRPPQPPEPRDSHDADDADDAGHDERGA